MSKIMETLFFQKSFSSFLFLKILKKNDFKIYIILKKKNES